MLRKSRVVMMAEKARAPNSLMVCVIKNCPPMEQRDNIPLYNKTSGCLMANCMGGSR